MDPIFYACMMQLILADENGVGSDGRDGSESISSIREAQ
jgi:hypothetical protein